jgi:hypothetical protein
MGVSVVRNKRGEAQLILARRYRNISSHEIGARCMKVLFMSCLKSSPSSV